jgi:hypothetical protein
MPCLLLASGHSQLDDARNAQRLYDCIGVDDKVIVVCLMWYEKLTFHCCLQTLLTFTACYRELLHEPERPTIVGLALQWLTRIGRGEQKMFVCCRKFVC